MQIPIPVPRWLVRAKGAFADWANVPLWQGPLWGRECELRRIDLMLTYGFIACVGWYYFMGGGWKGALAGGLTYIFVAMAALWF